jgi:hypothetical protein
MTTCLDSTACPNEKLYNIICNFSIGYNDYECNSNTCMRVDGTYDCCAINVYYCTQLAQASFLRMPTIQPTTTIRKPNCYEMCNAGTKINKCYWYENLRTDNLCLENDNEYCCSQNRSDCCSTNQTGVYIVFGCISGIIIIFAYYWYYVKNSHHKIVPAQNMTELESPDRYKMVNNL